jgi:DNA-binding NarL/FixJ family response regulator
MIHVMIVDDHTLLREGVKQLFEAEPDIMVVEEAANGTEAVGKLNVLNPDVLMLDINMPEMNGREVMEYLKDRSLDVNVLVLSMMDNEKYVTSMFEAGVLGYVLKDAGKDELIRAVKTVAAGEQYISNRLLLSMMERRSNQTMATGDKQNGQEKNDANAADSKFSKRELQIIQLLANGDTNEEIAHKTDTTTRTVETHRKNIMAKAHVSNKIALIRFAIDNGLIP